MKKVLITGGAGFVGVNLAISVKGSLKNKFAEFTLRFRLDTLSYPKFF